MEQVPKFHFLNLKAKKWTLTHISMKHEVSLVYITAHQAHQSAKRVTQIYNTTQCYTLKARITSLHITMAPIFFAF